MKKRVAVFQFATEFTLFLFFLACLSPYDLEFNINILGSQVSLSFSRLALLSSELATILAFLTMILFFVTLLFSFTIKEPRKHISFEELLGK